MGNMKIVILCATGASSSIIVKSIKNNARSRNFDVEVSCCPYTLYRELDFKGVDAILLAPQVKRERAEIEKYVESYKIAVCEIGMREYGLALGGEILDQVAELLQYKKSDQGT